MEQLWEQQLGRPSAWRSVEGVCVLEGRLGSVADPWEDGKDEYLAYRQERLRWESHLDQQEGRLLPALSNPIPYRDCNNHQATRYAHWIESKSQCTGSGRRMD
jgi:hypothetical protein